MSTMKCMELFPTKTSVIIFILYVALFVNQGILVTATQGPQNDYNYNIITVVLLTEFFKLVVSVILYCKDHSPYQLLNESYKYRNVFGLYFIPAFLYCLYNNLAFLNLSKFDPTTYYLLLQLRVVVTAVIFQIIFKKKLGRKQWISLVLLTIGCMLKQVNLTGPQKTTIDKSMGIDFSINTVFIFIQTLCSCLAGVYNEYLLKEPGANANMYMQNVFMYVDSIVCNMILLLIQGELSSAFLLVNLEKVFHYKVLLVIINNSAVGIITSFFLKSMNSILKTFASALELVFTAILSYLFFNIPVYANTALAILVVLFSIYLYSQNPVSNPSTKTGKLKQTDSEQTEILLEDV